MPKESESELLLKSKLSTKETCQNKDLTAFAGARPKIKSSIEGKRRKFPMKSAKSAAKVQPLESVSEQEEKSVKQTLLHSPKEDDPRSHQPRKCPEFFGVRSYVHTFYEAMAMDDPQSYDDTDYDNNGFENYLAPKQKRRRIKTLCKRTCVWSGTVLLFFGLLVLLVGFLMPRKPEIVGSEDAIRIINRKNQAFNKELDICKIIGVVVFCTGGCMITGVLIVLMFIKPHRMDDKILTEDIPAMAENEELLKSPTDVRVPATEELASVQPKRAEPEEVVMTNAGLCKVPP